MNIGDIVGRKSYNCDVYFKINSINKNIVILDGLSTRLRADSLIDDLVLISKDKLDKQIEEEKEYLNSVVRSYKNKIQHITGKILHFDSDDNYLNKCLGLYNSLNLYAVGRLIDENKMASVVLEEIRLNKPNIVVITGHDSFNRKDKKDLNNYTNSSNFAQTILKIRELYSLDDIVIYAGACGSNFEALIAAGANFASSIDRTNIEAFDPAIVACLAAITPHDQIIDIKSLYNFSKMERGSIGGVESYGKMRLLMR